jgi:hypothetical protein
MDDDDKSKGHALKWFAWLGSVVVFGSLWTVLFRRSNKSVGPANVALPLTVVPPGVDEPRPRVDLRATGPVLGPSINKPTHPEVAALLQGSSDTVTRPEFAPMPNDALSPNGTIKAATRTQTVAAATPVVAEPAAEKPAATTSKTAPEPSQWVAPQPQRFVVVPAKRRTNWFQLIAAVVVAAVALAGTAEAYLRFKSENVAIPDPRPNLTVRVSAIKRLEGDFLAEEAVDDKGGAAAVNAQLTTLIFSSAAEAQDFERRAQSGSSVSPVTLGVVVAGEHRMVYESPVAAHRQQLVFARKMERDLAVTVAGRVNYQDAEGRFYQTYFCYTRLAHTKFRDCTPSNPRNQTAPRPSRQNRELGFVSTAK